MIRQSNCQTDLKVILVGDERAGKTCLLKKLTENKFTEEYNPTIYDEFETRLEVDFGKREYRISLVELGGSDECAKYRQSCYEDGDVILICFSVVRPYEVISVGSKWLPEIQKYNPNAYVLLVGTQVDLREERGVVKDLRRNGLRAVTYENGCDLVELVQPYKVCGYLECSSLSRKGVVKVFEEMIKLTEPESKTQNYYPSRLNLSFLKIRKSRKFTKIHKMNFSFFTRFRSRRSNL